MVYNNRWCIFNNRWFFELNTFEKTHVFLTLRKQDYFEQNFRSLTKKFLSFSPQLLAREIMFISKKNVLWLYYLSASPKQEVSLSKRKNSYGYLHEFLSDFEAHAKMPNSCPFVKNGNFQIKKLFFLKS